MNQEIYKLAVDSEADNPRQALRAYSRLERENLQFRWDILLACLIGPIISFSLATWLLAETYFQNKFVALAIWVGIGLLPGFVVYEWRFRQAAATRVKKRIYDILYFIIVPLTIYFGTLAHFFAIAVVAALVMIPLLALSSLACYLIFQTFAVPTYLNYLLVLISLSYGTLVELSDPVRDDDELARNLLRFRRMLIGLRLRWKPALFFGASCLLLAYIREAELKYLFSEPTIGLASSVLGGALFALGYGYIERDFAVGHLLRMAKVRCALRLKRSDEVYMRMALVEEKLVRFGNSFTEADSQYREFILPLFEALRQLEFCSRYALESEDANARFWQVRQNLALANTFVLRSDPDDALYCDAIRSTRELL